jgi:hypothetical protein
MERTIFAILGICLLTSVVSPAVAIDLNSARGNLATELAPVESCTINQARHVMDDNDIKHVVTLPQTVKAMRFLGVSRQTGEMVGASVAILGCGLQVVTDIGMKRPWCEYLPSRSERCPTSFSRK